ncbi:uncharacterized protein LOC131247995 [Magnolia sinica]|uniref:uncharacterized protein LOC131247995 n=1 Tax=Magnolia sinica TaxID=86752 RepID=UPI002659AB35|nr:uncharacterized protein LOC131247995 [Magnolia sinica]
MVLGFRRMGGAGGGAQKLDDSDFQRGSPLLSPDQKNRVVCVPGIAEAAGSRRRKAASTVDEMLRAEPRTKMTVWRKQAAPRGEGPLAPIFITAAPAVASVSVVVSPVVASISIATALAAVPIIAANALAPIIPPAVVPPTAEAPPVAPEPRIAVPSSSELEEAVRMADAMLSPLPPRPGMILGPRVKPWQAAGLGLRKQ